jgi:hypothetical protein
MSRTWEVPDETLRIPSESRGVVARSGGLRPVPPPEAQSTVGWRRRAGISPLPQGTRSCSSPSGEVAAAEPPCARRNGSFCQIASRTRAEPLMEGVKALRSGSRSDAAGLRGSWNRLTPSASLRSAPPPEGRNPTGIFKSRVLRGCGDAPIRRSASRDKGFAMARTPTQSAESHCRSN